MKRIILLIYILVLTITIGFGQSTNIDTLTVQLKKAKTDSAKAKLHYLISWDYLGSNLDSSLVHNQKAYTLSKKNNSTSIEALVLDERGYIFSYLGKSDEAISAHFDALKIHQKLNSSKGMITSYNGIGGIFYEKSNFPKALYYFNLALIESKKVGKKNMILTTLNHIGGVHISMLQYEQANKKFRDALSYADSTTSPLDIGDIYENMTSVYLKLGNPDSALVYGLASLDQFKFEGEKTARISDILNMLGEVYAAKNDVDKAIYYNEKSYNMASELSIELTQKQACKKLYVLYEKKNDIHKTNYFLKKYIQLQDSSYDSGNSDQIEMKYNLEKEEEIRLKEKELVEYKNKFNLYSTIGVSIILLLILLGLGLRYRTNKRTNAVLVSKNKIIEEKQLEILDSINYAKRIQQTLLAHDSFLKENLSEHFVLFKPKDIVSGDFYWAAKKDNRFYLAVCDSTGHGVPGAFMSLLNIGFMNEAIVEKNIANSNEVLDYVREKLIHYISKDGQQDGFDGTLICFDKTNSKTTYASANNAPITISNGAMLELEKDKMPVGIGEKKERFRLFELASSKNKMLYLYTDGYADQFGGKNGKKFKYKQLNELLTHISDLPMEQQKIKLENAFNDWKGNLEQVDDVCIIGIRL